MTLNFELQIGVLLYIACHEHIPNFLTMLICKNISTSKEKNIQTVVLSKLL